MNLISKHVVEIPSRTAPPGKVFTYPTRLVEAWCPRIMEFYIPEEHRKSIEIEITACHDSTCSLGFNRKTSLKAIYQSFTEPIAIEDGFIYDSRYDTDGNIAHILSGAVPEILVCQKYFSNVQVVLRSKATQMARNVYKALDIPTICTDKAVRGQILAFKSSSGERFNGQGRYESLYYSLFKDQQFKGYIEQTPERVFISRKGKRRLINEDEVAGMLEEYGFQKFYFEDIPIAQQWSIARNAKVVVGVHGAALANLLLNQGGFMLVELFHPGYVVNMYRNITHQMGGKWVGVAGQITEEVIKKLDFEQQPRAFALTSTKIDLTSLQIALDYLGLGKT